MELLIDVGDVIPERAHANLKPLCHFLRVFTVSEKTENLLLFSRQRKDWRQFTRPVRTADKPPGYSEHFARELLGLLPPTDVAHQVNDQATLSVFVVCHQQRDVDPHTPACVGADLHIKVGNVSTGPHAFEYVTRLAAQKRPAVYPTPD